LANKRACWDFTSQDLENCIARKCQVEVSDTNVEMVKLERADGGYLGTQRRRRTWLPTICAGELEASDDPAVSEWGNPKYGHLNT
jgi:hypothetical protein